MEEFTCSRGEISFRMSKDIFQHEKRNIFLSEYFISFCFHKQTHANNDAGLTIFRRLSITFRRSVIQMQELSAAHKNVSEHFPKTVFTLIPK